MYRIIRYRPRERDPEYAECCSQLLQACAEQDTALTHATTSIGILLARIFSTMIGTLVLPLTIDSVSVNALHR